MGRGCDDSKVSVKVKRFYQSRNFVVMAEANISESGSLVGVGKDFYRIKAIQ